MHKEIIKSKGKEEQEIMVTDERLFILKKFIKEALENFQN